MFSGSLKYLESKVLITQIVTVVEFKKNKNYGRVSDFIIIRISNTL